MKYALVNGDFYTGESVLYNKAVIIDGEFISQIVGLDKVPRELEVIDVQGANISPGFIDIQVNGGGGLLFNDSPTGESIKKISEAHRHFGTTSFLPTLITTSIEKIIQAIDSVQQAMKHSSWGVLGMHLEGPYINETKAGVHDKKYVRRSVGGEFFNIIEKGKGIVRLFTTAPEVIGESQVKQLTQNKILVSAGHTNATYEEAIKFFGYGGSAVTHLYNAMSQLGSREPGVVGAAFDSKEVWAGIIVDGMHVDFTSVRIAKKIKGPRLILVTDAMPPVGAQMTSYRLGDLQINVTNGKCTTNDGTLAGSALDMASAVRNCVQKVGIPLDEALRMGSKYPANFIGVGDVLGMIAPGYFADLVIFNNQMTVMGTVKRGIYQSIN